MGLKEDAIILGVVAVGGFIVYKTVIQNNILKNPTTTATGQQKTGTYELMGNIYVSQPSPTWYLSSGRNFINVLNPFSSLNPSNIATKNLFNWVTK